MAFDEELALRLRDAMSDVDGIVEKKMFGGLAFMVNGHMSVGITGDDLMVRVGPEQYESALSDPHAREMDFTKTPLRGFVYVEPAGIKTEKALRAWIDRSLDFVRTLPPK